MAKAENIRDDESLLGGLSFGASKQATQETPGAKAASVTQTAQASDVPQALVKGYKDSKEERRNVKLNILIRPSTAKLLEKAVQRKEIKSKNDLINYLLEQYLSR